MIADLCQENKDLRIQVKDVEDLNKAIPSSRDSRQERKNILKAQARKLKFKSLVSFNKSKAVANTTQPSF